MKKLFAIANMKRAKLCFISLFTFTFSLFTHVSAQIAINNTAANPDASAILDLNTGNAGVNKGFLAPQVALTNVTVAAPVTTPATGLIVYTTTAPTGGNGVGYYYWNGTKWDGLGTSPALLNLTQGTGITAFSYNGSSAATVGLANTGVTAGSYGSATTVPTYTVNAQGQITGAANITITSSSGTVTNFSSGNLAPLFTTSVATSTTTPALTYSLSKAAAYTMLGNNTNASAVPTYFTPVLASALFQNQGTATTVLHGNGSGNPSWSSVDLTTDVTNNLPVTNLNSGAGANSGTFWRGDGTWATPAGGSINGSGTNGYLALWTPNSSTLGTSVIQDDGTEVGIGSAPQSGILLYSNSSAGTAIQGVTTTGTAGYFTAAGGVQATLASGGTLDGIDAIGANFGGTFQSYGYYGYIGDAVEGAGAHFQDGAGNYAYLAYESTGITAYGLAYGGSFSSSNGESMTVAATNNGAAAYFADNSGDYGYLGYEVQGMGVYVTGSVIGAEFVSSSNTNSAQLADGIDNYGINAYGTNIGGYFSDPNGDYAAIALNGSKIGVAGDGVSCGGQFQDVSGGYNGSIGDAVDGMAAFFDNPSGTYMYVCQGGSGYITNGSKSTAVKDKNNNERLLFCNESPEVMFEDYGEGQLVNGKVHITLDSLFAMNVAISDKHPLRVFVQLNDTGCKGVAVMNKTIGGFDVIEINGGKSSTPFEWHIICNRANETGEDRNYAEKRFPAGPIAPKKPEMAMQKQIGNPKVSAPAKGMQATPSVKKASN